MTDLTATTTPYGLLDAEAQRALREHGGPYQYFYLTGNWEDYTDPKFKPLVSLTYRVKPEPPKPREWWINRYANGEVGRPHQTKAIALGRVVDPDNLIETIHVREVIE